jgi:hypothetical protein
MKCELHYLERRFEPFQLLLENDEIKKHTVRWAGRPRETFRMLTGSGKQMNAVLL